MATIVVCDKCKEQIEADDPTQECVFVLPINDRNSVNRKVDLCGPCQKVMDRQISKCLCNGKERMVD